MNDQPKPATGGEWTVERIHSYKCDGDLIADINAALAAEREAHEGARIKAHDACVSEQKVIKKLRERDEGCLQLMERVTRLEQQLAAEREKGYDKGYEECRALWIKDPEIQQLRADNERLKQQYEMTALDCSNTRKREAAAQAEADLWKRQSAFESEHREKYKLRSERLAEATKPLVDGLQDIASGIPDRKQMIEVAIAALEKVVKQ